MGARWALRGLLAELWFQRAPGTTRFLAEDVNESPLASLFWLWWRGEAAPQADLAFVPSGRAAGLTCPTQGERGLRLRRRPDPGLRPRVGRPAPRPGPGVNVGELAGIPKGLCLAPRPPRTSFQSPAGPHPKPARRPRSRPVPRPPQGLSSLRAASAALGCHPRQAESRWAQQESSERARRGEGARGLSEILGQGSVRPGRAE